MTKRRKIIIGILSIIFILIITYLIIEYRKDDGVLFRMSLSDEHGDYSYCFTVTKDGQYTVQHGKIKNIYKIDTYGYVYNEIKSGKRKLNQNDFTEIINYADDIFIDYISNPEYYDPAGTFGGWNVNIYYNDKSFETYLADNIGILYDKLGSITPIELDYFYWWYRDTDFTVPPSDTGKWTVPEDYQE